MKKNILFISNYSEENYLLAKHLCSHRKESCAFFFDCKKKSLQGTDYMDSITKYDDDFSSRAFVSERSHLEEDLAIELYSFLKEINIQPDLIIFKGSASQSLPIASIKEFSGLEIPTFCILENVNEKYSFQEISILQTFESIMLMDDIDSNLKDFCKTRILFPGFLTSKIKNLKDLDPIFYFPILEEKIAFTNNENYNKICEDIAVCSLKFNICSYEGMSGMDIFIMSMLSSEIYDLTENKYFSLIINKMGKKTHIQMASEQSIDNNSVKNLSYGQQWEDCFKDFFVYIEKEINNDLKNYLKESNVITASTVTI